MPSNSLLFNPDVGDLKPIRPTDAEPEPDPPAVGTLGVGKTMQFSQDLQLTNLGNHWYAMVENDVTGPNTLHNALHDQMFLFNTETRMVAQAFDSDHNGSYDQISAQWLVKESVAEQKDWFRWQAYTPIENRTVHDGYEQLIIDGEPQFDDDGNPIPDYDKEITHQESFTTLDVPQQETFNWTGLMFKKETGQGVTNISEFYQKVSNYLANEGGESGTSGALLGQRDYELLTGGARIDFKTDSVDYQQGPVDPDTGERPNVAVARQYDSVWIDYDRGGGKAQAFTVEFNLFEDNGAAAVQGICFAAAPVGRDEDEDLGTNHLVDLVGQHGMYLRGGNGGDDPTGYRMDDRQYLATDGTMHRFDEVDGVPTGLTYPVPEADVYEGAALDTTVAHLAKPHSPMDADQVAQWLPNETVGALITNTELRNVASQAFTDDNSYAKSSVFNMIYKGIFGKEEGSGDDDQADEDYGIGASESGISNAVNGKRISDGLTGDVYMDHALSKWDTTVPTTALAKDSVGTRTAKKI